MRLTTALWEAFVLEANRSILGHEDCLRMPVPVDALLSRSRLAG